MDFAQRWRRLVRGTGTRRAPAGEDPVVETVAPSSVDEGPRPLARLGRLKIAGLVLAAILLLYYPLGSILDHQINDDVVVRLPASTPVGGSQAVALAAALIDREVNQTGWVANTPLFAPNALLKFGGNMMNFQTGMIAALGRFALELEDSLGRTRGSSATDPDLEAARGRLQAPVDKWVLRPSGLPQISSPGEYRQALTHLRRYNTRLAAGEAVFDVRADNLLRVLDRIASDVGSASDQLDEQVAAGRRVLIDRRADKLYYNVKGRSYGYAVILRGLRADFSDVIDEREGVAALYDSMLADLDAVASAKPLVVMNGSTEGALAPNHLAAQGFALLRARTKLREITDILAK